MGRVFGGMSEYRGDYKDITVIGWKWVGCFSGADIGADWWSMDALEVQEIKDNI